MTGKEHAFVAWKEINGWNVTVRADSIEELLAGVDKVKVGFGGKAVASQEKESNEEAGCAECGNLDYWVNLVKKEGPNKGKHFKTCKKCGNFLGWTEEPLTNK